MTKLLKPFLILVLVGFLAACGNNDDKKDENTTNTTDTTNDMSTGEGAGAGTENGDVSSNGDQKVDVADDVAEKIAELDEVDAASVIVSESNAYVAVRMKDGNEGSEDLEKRIGDKAREAGRDFDHVYVSLDPDFVERMSEYGNQIRAGEPIEGFYDEFKTTLEDVFPDSH